MGLCLSLSLGINLHGLAQERNSPAPIRLSAIKPGVYEFSYEFPPQAHAIPKLAACLKKQAASKKRKLIANATPRYRRLNRNTSPHGDQDITTWSLAANTDKLLVLDGALTSYLGGAHGDYNSDSLYWDKENNRKIQFEDIFISRVRFQNALQADFCAMLDTQRREKRKDNPENIHSTDWACPPLTAVVTTIPSSSKDGSPIDHVLFKLDPYMAGPFGEGEYRITLKVTPALMEAIKPLWRSEFSLGP